MWRIPILLKHIFSPAIGLTLCILLIAAIDSFPREGIGEVAWSDVGNQYFTAKSGGDAGESTFSLNNYNVVVASLTETFDKRSCFAIAVSGDEVCYSCVHDIQAQVIISFTTKKTDGTANSTQSKYAIGQGATTTIDDGDEISEEHMQVHPAADGAAQNLTVMSTTVISTSDCIALMGQTNNVGVGDGGYTHDAISLTIVEF